MATLNENVLNLQKIISQVANTDVTTNNESMPYMSTSEVPPNRPVDTKAYELAYQAKAGLSHHIQGILRSDNAAIIRSELQPFLDPLRDLQYSDTTVIVKNMKIDKPGILNKYANMVDQNQATSILSSVCGRHNAVRIFLQARLAGQADKPTLWLVQLLYIESKMPYVYTLRHNQDLIRLLPKDIEPEKHGLYSQAVQELFGPVMYVELDNIARSNELSVYSVFMIMLELILAEQEEKRKPQRISTVWDSLQTDIDQFFESRK